MNNYTIEDPVFRINRSTTLQLTTSWQTIDFNGNSTYNRNTFGIDPVSDNKMVYWDSTNKLVRFIGTLPYTKSYSFAIFPETNTNIITTRATLQIRYVIPDGISPGVDLVFPYVDSATPYADIGEVTILANGIRHYPLTLDIPVSSGIITNGVRVQMRLSNSLFTLGVCNLTNCSLQIQ